MSIIKTLQDYLTGYDGMSMRPLSEILTDRPDEQPSSYALAPTGNNKLVTDIIGNRTYQHSYVFYAKEAAADEVDRQENYDFLEDFTGWLEEKNAAGDLPVLPGKYQAESLEVSNAMLMDLYEDGAGLYQVQIQFIFTKKRRK